jgi:hypothetical protein
MTKHWTTVKTVFTKCCSCNSIYEHDISITQQKKARAWAVDIKSVKSVGTLAVFLWMGVYFWKL